MSEQFKGQVAIITGAASGLGLAIAKKLHAVGVRVAMFDLNQGALLAASQEVGENAAAFPADITDEAQVSGCVAQIGQRFGRIHILVNSAGVTGQDTDAALRHARRGRSDVGLHRLARGQLHHRIHFRPDWRPGDLLIAYGAGAIIPKACREG
jgi:NAD(P)-dependent dehydrogenase (short-subunit alcohol dehydrogenase family)